jgi:hypothetical protein
MPAATASGVRGMGFARIRIAPGIAMDRTRRATRDSIRPGGFFALMPSDRNNTATAAARNPTTANVQTHNRHTLLSMGTAQDFSTEQNAGRSLQQERTRARLPFPHGKYVHSVPAAECIIRLRRRNSRKSEHFPRNHRASPQGSPWVRRPQPVYRAGSKSSIGLPSGSSS